MTTTNQRHADVLQDRFGLGVAAWLSAGTEELPHDVSERLRIARMQALSRRKQSRPLASASVVSSAGTATLGDENHYWWGWLASAVPLLLLVIGLVAIDGIQQDNFAREVATVDAALLVDDLPPAAYADPGFVQFVKNARDGLQ